MIFGARTNFTRRAVDFSFAQKPIFFDADSIDVDASIDRDAQKRAQMFSGLRCICLMNSTHRDFRDPNKIESARLVTHPSAPKYILQRRFDLDASIDLAHLAQSIPSTLEAGLPPALLLLFFPFLSSSLFSFLSDFRFHWLEDKFKSALITREKTCT